jgi:hypothetical protein
VGVLPNDWRISCEGAGGSRRATSSTVLGAAASAARARPRQLHALVRQHAISLTH